MKRTTIGFRKAETKGGTESYKVSKKFKTIQKRKKMTLTSTQLNVNNATTSLNNAQITELCMTKRRRIADEENPKFTHPKTNKPLNKIITKLETTTNNKFQTISIDTTEEDVTIMDTENMTVQDNVENVAKKSRPPPIIIHEKFTDHKKMNDYLKTKLGGNHYWKHSPYTTALYLEKYEDWKMCNTIFQEGKLEYHTFTPKEEKTHAFVLKGIFHNIELEDIKNELIMDHKINCKNVYTMRGTKWPMFLIITDGAVTIRELQSKVRHMDNTAVRWERHINNKLIIQCHRCQRWGHATTNCRASPKCLKCAKSHLTRECDRKDEDAIKCANCSGQHPANSTECKIYKIKITQIENRNSHVPPSPQMKYIAAPAPTANIWEARKEALATQNEVKTSPAVRTSRPPLLPTPPITNSSQDGGDMTQLSLINDEFNKLSQLVDLDQMLRRVRYLNGKLTNCNSEIEKFEVFYKFTQDISNNVI